jgi:glutathionylspermidine synthase
VSSTLPAAATVCAAPAADFGADPVRTASLGLADGEFTELLRALRFRYYKWDTFSCGRCNILPEAMVLSRQAHEQVVAVVEALDGALRRFERAVRTDPAALRELAVPDALHGIIADEREETLQIARYDLFPCEDGRWMVSEFNEDVPGGFNEAVIPHLLGDPLPGTRWEGDLQRSFVDAFRGYESVAFLYATGFSEDLQHMLILEDWLRHAGHRTGLGSPAHLQRRWFRPHILGQRIDAAFRFYPAEWMPVLPNLDVWRRLGPQLPMMNPIHRLVRQSKKVFGVWRTTALPADLALIDRHCPVTLPFGADSPQRLRDEKARWVIKRAFGRMGDAVLVGGLLSDAEWAAAIAEAAQKPAEYCIQERFAATPLDFEGGPLYPAIGAFIVNGRFAGYYSRAAAHPVTTHEAAHVATLIEAT